MNITESVLDYEGKPLTAGESSGIPLTWRGIVSTALNNVNPNETLTDDEKSRCFYLTVKTYEKEDVEYSLEDRALILRRIKKIFTSPLICGRAEEFFK